MTITCAKEFGKWVALTHRFYCLLMYMWQSEFLSIGMEFAVMLLFLVLLIPHLMIELSLRKK